MCSHWSPKACSAQISTTPQYDHRTRKSGKGSQPVVKQRVLGRMSFDSFKHDLAGRMVERRDASTWKFSARYGFHLVNNSPPTPGAPYHTCSSSRQFDVGFILPSSSHHLGKTDEHASLLKQNPLHSDGTLTVLLVQRYFFSMDTAMALACCIAGVCTRLDWRLLNRRSC